MRSTTTPSRPSWLPIIKGMKDYMDAPEIAIEYYVFNTTKPPMDDNARPQGVQHGDRQGSAGQVPRRREAADGVHARRHLSRLPAAEGRRLQRRARPRTARRGRVSRQLPATTIPARFPVGDVEILYNTSESNRQVAEFVQAQWKQNLGITVPLRNMEFRTFLVARANLEYKGFARAGWIGDYMDPFTFLDIFSTPDREQQHRMVGSDVRPDARRGQPHARSAEALRAAREGRGVSCSTSSR